MEAMSVNPEIEKADVITKDRTNTIYIKSGGTTFEIIELFNCEQTYLDIVKSAIRREYDGN